MTALFKWEKFLSYFSAFFVLNKHNFVLISIFTSTPGIEVPGYCNYHRALLLM